MAFIYGAPVFPLVWRLSVTKNEAPYPTVWPTEAEYAKGYLITLKKEHPRFSRSVLNLLHLKNGRMNKNTNAVVKNSPSAKTTTIVRILPTFVSKFDFTRNIHRQKQYGSMQYYAPAQYSSKTKVEALVLCERGRTSSETGLAVQSM